MSGLDVVALVGVLVSFAVMFILVFKGMHVVWATVICTIILVITNRLNLLDSINTLFVSCGDSIPQFAPVILFGAVFSKVMDYTGAARSFATTLYKYAVPKSAEGNRRRAWTIVITIILEVVLVYAGIDQFAILFIMMPILATVCEEVNIRRRYLPALILAAAGIACAMPGCANVSNTIPMGLTGSTSMGGMVPGFIGAAVVAAGVCLYLVKSVNKAVATGENFEWGEVLKPSAVDGNVPPFILSIIPILVVVIAFNAFGLAAQYALALAAIVGCIILYKWIPIPEQQESNVKGHFHGIYKMMLDGLMSIAPIILIFLSMGFASVISETRGYEILLDLVMKVNLNPTITFAIIMCLLVGIMINPVGAMMVAIPFAMSAFPDLSPFALHRIASFSYIVLDSMPFAAGIIVAMNMAGLKQKEAYKHLFFTTVVWAAVGFAVVVLLFTLNPGWH